MAMWVAVIYILALSLDWQGLWDLKVEQRELRGLKVAQSVAWS